MTHIRYASAASAVGLMILLSGCGDSKVVKVSGTLTHNGKAIPHAVTFTPDVGRPSWGMSDENGRFTLKHTVKDDGVERGPHKVTIEFPPATVQEENDLTTGKKAMAADRKEILKKYGAGAPPLQLEITGSTDNLEIKLD